MKQLAGFGAACAAGACILGADVYAATPRIAAVESAGSQMVISGDGFGLKSRAAPLLFDSVVNQPAYEGLEDGQPITAGEGTPYSEATPSSPGSVLMETRYARSPDTPKHYRTKDFKGHVGWPYALGGTKPPANQNEIYFSYWFRPDGEIYSTGHSSKFVRFWDNYGGLGTRISWTQMHLTYPGITADGSISDSVVSWAPWGGSIAEWNRMELYVNAGTGQIKAWTNGKLVHAISNFKKSAAYADVGLSIGNVGWDRGGSSPPEVNVSFGEIYVDNTPARVELCDSSLWATCKKREVQIASEWTDKRVVFTVTKGLLKSASNLYVYVVNADGAVNAEGFLVDTCRECPRPPANVVVD